MIYAYKFMNLLPKDDRILRLFEQHAQILGRASKLFVSGLKDGYDEEQGAALRQNNKIAVVSGPYQPEDQPAITHQIRIRILAG